MRYEATIVVEDEHGTPHSFLQTVSGKHDGQKWVDSWFEHINPNTKHKIPDNIRVVDGRVFLIKDRNSPQEEVYSRKAGQSAFS